MAWQTCWLAILLLAGTTEAVNVLVVYTADGADATKSLAQGLALGARSAGATVKIALATEAKISQAQAWADAIALGSGVYNGNVQPELMQFVNEWDFNFPMSGKVGTSFATGGSAFAGVQPVLESLMRAMMTFGMVIVGGSSWKSAEGTGASDPPDQEAIEMAKSQGVRLVRTAALLISGSTVPQPPGLPTKWAAHPVANYTSPGYDGGTLDIQFATDCVQGNPMAQKISTVYPDGYTVLTRCDLGVHYIIDPNSRGGSCETWPIEDDDQTCRVCACPFCIRDTKARWGDETGGFVKWDNATMTVCPLTGEKIQIFSGIQEKNNNAITYAVSVDTGLPISLAVDSKPWLSISTLFKNFTTTVDSTVFNKPALCEQHRTAPKGPFHGTTAPKLQRGLKRQFAKQLQHLGKDLREPPPFPEKYRADIKINISQPGYQGGNVFTSVVADCSSGAAKQLVKTTYGNFHTVLVNCEKMMVYDYDLSGIHCETTPIATSVGVDPRVCQACALPFGMRDTDGVWAISFSWATPVANPDGGLTYSGTNDTLGISVAMDANGVPLSEVISQQGWQTTILKIANFTIDVSIPEFTLPPCFNTSMKAYQ